MMLIGMNSFVNNSDDENLLKSMIGREDRDQDELVKALDKSGLVQVQTTVKGKNGTYTRMQWKRASDVKDTDKVVGQQPAEDKKPADDKPDSVSAQSLSSLPYDEIVNKLKEMPVGTKITGIRDKSGRWDFDTTVEKHEGYVANYAVGNKRKETWWTVSSSKSHEFEIANMITGKNKYYGIQDAGQKKPKNKTTKPKNTMEAGADKLDAIIRDLSVDSHPDDFEYARAQIDKLDADKKINGLLGRVDNADGYPLQGKEGIAIKDASDSVKQKIVDILKDRKNYYNMENYTPSKPKQKTKSQSDKVKAGNFTDVKDNQIDVSTDLSKMSSDDLKKLSADTLKEIKKVSGEMYDKENKPAGQLNYDVIPEKKKRYDELVRFNGHILIEMGQRDKAKLNSQTDADSSMTLKEWVEDMDDTEVSEMYDVAIDNGLANANVYSSDDVDSDDIDDIVDASKKIKDIDDNHGLYETMSGVKFIYSSGNEGGVEALYANNFNELKKKPEAKKQSKPDKKQEEKKPAIELPKTKDGLKKLLGSGVSRDEIMSTAKANGVTWKHNDHAGINWMRCCMALTGTTTKGSK